MAQHGKVASSAAIVGGLILQLYIHQKTKTHKKQKTKKQIKSPPIPLPFFIRKDT